MKHYCGKRTIDGILVTVDGNSLDEQFDVQVYDEKGFEWSYVGSAPSQLALALLVDHLQDADKAKVRVEAFANEVIANLDNDWDLTSEDIEQALTDLAAVKG